MPLSFFSASCVLANNGVAITLGAMWDECSLKTKREPISENQSTKGEGSSALFRTVFVGNGNVFAGYTRGNKSYLLPNSRLWSLQIACILWRSNMEAMTASLLLGFAASAAEVMMVPAGP